MELSQTASIKLIAKEFKKLGYLEIEENKIRENQKQRQTFYYISEENVKNIYSHICTFSEIDFNDEIYYILIKDKKNITKTLIKDLKNRFSKGNEFYEKIYSLLLEKSISFFFLFILESGNATKNEEFRESFVYPVFNKLLSKVVMTVIPDAMKIQEFSKLLSTVDFKDEFSKFFTFFNPKIDNNLYNQMLNNNESIRKMLDEFHDIITNTKNSSMKNLIFSDPNGIEAIGYMAYYHLKEKLNEEDLEKIKNLDPDELKRRMERVYAIYEQILFTTIKVESDKIVKISEFAIGPKPNNKK